MEETPLVSIAMTTYNGEKYLRQQLDSIYNQTYKNIEVIVTDDCSTDTTVQILEEYAQQFGLKYFVNEQNLGFVKNFEKAISLCSGEYIALSDQDDIWLPEKLETLINEINGYSLVCSDAKLIDQDGNIFAESFREYSGLEDATTKPFIYMFFRFFVTGCTCLMTKELAEKSLPLPNKEVYHDWWLALNARKLNKIKYINKSMVLYRQHGQNQIGASPYQPDILNKFKKSIKYIFNQTYRKKLTIEKLKYKTLLDGILRSNFPLEPQERKTIEEVIFSLNNFIENRFDFKQFIIYFKYYDLLFIKKIPLILNLLAYNFNIIEDKLKK